MLHIDKWKIILIIFLSFLGVIYALPNVLSPETRAAMEEHLPGWAPTKTVNLGLDLRGGSHLLLHAETAAVLAERMEAMVEAARTDLRKEDITYSNLAKTAGGITFKLLNPTKDQEEAYKIARSLHDRAAINVSADGVVDVKLDEASLNDIKTQIINQSIEIVRRRVDESGTKEPVIQRQGVDRIVVQLPGVSDPGHIKELIGKTAKMGFHLVDIEAVSAEAGPGSMKLPMHGAEMAGQFAIVKKRIMVTGEMLTDAQPAFDQQGPVVSFRFDSVGSKRFCEVTRDNIGRPFAIVLDNEVISAPVIRDAICSGSGQISGNFSVKEANDLALLLRAGALPAPLTVVEERTVGPTLGSDSVSAGKIAAAVAFVAVIVLMAASYGLFGIFADIALTLNLIFIFAVLSIMQATLTLPGIAGIILTIGIAVDANVLIYERIREELRQGRSIMSAIDTGYRLAWNTIVDSNLTTLIVAIILFSFGSGPVKGFAVAMCIGIITSMFAAIMLTRLMVVTWLKKTRPSALHL
jgi:preprotein translocase subunit SecD